MITVVGSFNMDLFIEAPRFPAPGETLLGQNFRRAYGGKGANQAFAIARMGTPVAMIGAVGSDAFGEEMIANLQSAGVDTAHVLRRTDVASGVAVIVLDAAGQNQIVIASGANGTLTAADIEQRAELFSRSRAVVVQLETPVAAVEAALRLARKSNSLAVLNPAPFLPLPAEVVALADWLIPNENEAAQLAGVHVCDVATAPEVARELKRTFGVRNIIITLGANGVWLDAAQFTGHVAGFSVKAIDTVGAGDTFIGAFVSRLVEGAAPDEAACFGCAAAAIAVTRRGAQTSVPRRQEVEHFQHQAAQESVSSITLREA